MPEKIEDTNTRQLIKEMFAEFMPLIKEIALTPEKLREAQKPWVDPDKLAQQLHQKKLQQSNDDTNRKIKETKQAQCGHVDPKGDTAIHLVHNFPDNQPRGFCRVCDLWIHPGHYDWRPETQPDGSIKEVAKWEKEHPLYHLVRRLEYTS